MSKEELKQQLIDTVIESIKVDMLCEDYTAIDELLNFTPIENLIGFLPEEDWGKYKLLNQNKDERRSGKESKGVVSRSVK